MRKWMILFILLLIPSFCFAGPMGKPFGFVGSGWTPARQTSGGSLPVHWYKADGTNYQDSAGTIPAAADGDVVGLLTDYGSVVSGVSQPTTINKPTLQTAELNGKSVFRIDGSNDWMQGPFASSMAQPITIFIVAMLNPAKINDDNTYYLFDGDHVVNRIVAYKDGGATPDKWYLYAGGNVVGGSADGNWNIWTGIYNGVGSQLWHNGVSEGTGDVGSNEIDGITFGSSYLTSSPWFGDIAEVIFYGSNLSTADKNQVAQYLATKYGLSYTAIP